MKIRGVVDARSGNASKSKGGPWVLTLALRPWRREDGSLVDGEALVWRCCSNDEALKSARAERPVTGTVVEVTVETPERLPGLEFRLRAPHEFAYVSTSNVDDPELASFAERTAPPREVTDPVLGTFVFEPDLRSYRCERVSPSGASYRVRISPPDEKAPHGRIAQARATVEWVESHLSEIRRSVADQLWDLWDDGSRQEDEDHIDRAAFEQHLALGELTWDDAQDEGDLTLYFSEGGLFGNHGIAVEISGWTVRSAELYG